MNFVVGERRQGGGRRGGFGVAQQHPAGRIAPGRLFSNTGNELRVIAQVSVAVDLAISGEPQRKQPEAPLEHVPDRNGHGGDMPINSAAILEGAAVAGPADEAGRLWGPSRDIHFYQKIQQEAKAIHNVEFIGQIPHSEIEKYYSKASIFVNTSNIEGFPNTFIEAWLFRMPVVSLEIDPDEVISKNNLGFHSKTFNQMVRDVKTLISNKNLREQMGTNGLYYVKREHNIKENVDLFIEYIFKLGD